MFWKFEEIHGGPHERLKRYEIKSEILFLFVCTMVCDMPVLVHVIALYVWNAVLSCVVNSSIW